MKKYLDIIIAIIAILAVAAFFVFLFDLAWFDRVAKMCRCGKSRIKITVALHTVVQY